MSEIFPYQLVGFLDKEPVVGEPVYSGENGWYAQITLKRRFAIESLTEKELFRLVGDYCSSVSPLEIVVGKLVKPKRMPVSVLEVEPTDELLNFHNGFIEALGEYMKSRFPERDGDNYYPHITVEYDGKNVINANLYAEQTFTLYNVWVLKDVTDDSSEAYASFPLS